MAKKAIRILKSPDVKLEGQIQLEVLQPEPGSMNENASRSEPVVRIIENRAEFATIETTCSCGAQMYLRCEYAAGPTSDEDLRPPPNVQPNEAHGE